MDLAAKRERNESIECMTYFYKLPFNQIQSRFSK